MSRLLLRTLSLCALLFAAGCGEGTVSGDDGPGGGTTGPDATPPGSACTPRVPARCDVTFTYAQADAQTCELRGSFDDWGPGRPMPAAGGRFSTTLSLENGAVVAYKFLLDGERWVADPTNPVRSMDGFGNSLRTVECSPVCADDGGGAGGGAGGGTPAPVGGSGGGGATVPVGGWAGPGGGTTGGSAGGDPGPVGGDPDPMGGHGGEGGVVVPPPPPTAPPPGDCPPPPPVGDFREETIYFLLTTRFFNGDPDNDYYNRDRLELGDPTWRGDFKGLIEQLDYIHDTLGFTAIWITPVVENRSGLDYHGYHGYDFTRVDPRLESPGATFQDLICEVHRRGMKLVLDIVINHSSNYGLRGVVHNARAPIKYFRKTGAFPSDDPEYPYQTHLGDYRSENREDDDNPLAPQIFREFDPEGAHEIECPVCGQTIPVDEFQGYQNHDPNHFFNIQSDRLDDTWYHQAGFMAGGDWESPLSLQQKHMAGDCIDLNTEHPQVKRYIVDAYNRFLDMGVDALRVDTVKHIERSNLLEYVNAFKEHKPGLFVFGENLVKGTGWGTCLDGSDNGPAEIRPWWYTRLTQDPCGGGHDDSGFRVLDFSLMSTFRDNLSQGRFGGLGGVFARDGLYGDATQLVTFIDNHDIGPQNDWKYRFAGSDTALASALNLIFLARGIPAVFYGTEIRFMAGAEIDGNDAPHATSGRAYFGDHLEPGRLAQTQGHPFVGHLRRLNALRAASEALQKGRQTHFGESDNSAWFVRNHEDRAFAVVGLSQGGDRLTVGDLPAGRWVDAVRGEELRTGPGGALTFDVAPGGARVFILDGPGRVGDDGVYLR
jgi:glycosidase